MVVIKINRQMHASLLADHRKDPVTKELLKVGDEVVVCANCKTVYLKDVWVRSKNGNCCSQNKTADSIPNIEFSTIKKNSIPERNAEIKVVKKFYPGVAVVFGIAAIIATIFAFKWKQQYDTEHDKVETLNSQVDGAAAKNNSMSGQLNNLNSSYTTLSSKYQDLKKLIAGFSFTAGLKFDERNKYNYVYGNSLEKVYFIVRSPIFLKSMKVDAKGSGYLRAKIYTDDGTLVVEAYNDEITDGEEMLSFNHILPIGTYYLTHDGNTELGFNDNFVGYPIKSNGLIELTGTEYQNNSYYMYYYEWEYSVIPD